MDCLFCKILKGEIPNYTVYQDENVLVFLDIHPCATGHTVVIPKKHWATMSEVPAGEWQKIAAGLQKAVQQVEKKIKPEGMNVGLNDRPVAGQAVPHLHWHIIPRFRGDGGGSMHSIIRNKEATPAAEVWKLFK